MLRRCASCRWISGGGANAQGTFVFFCLLTKVEMTRLQRLSRALGWPVYSVRTGEQCKESDCPPLAENLNNYLGVIIGGAIAAFLVRFSYIIGISEMLHIRTDSYADSRLYCQSQTNSAGETVETSWIR